MMSMQNETRQEAGHPSAAVGAVLHERLTFFTAL
jgi:hypothetical protein